MSPSVGISAYLADSWLSTLSPNIAYAAPVIAFKPHLGIPGAAGTAHPAAITTRVAAAFQVVAGVATITGLSPSWLGVAGETLSHLSAWDGLTDGSNFLFSGALLVPRLVAQGDVIPLGAFTFTFKNLASD